MFTKEKDANLIDDINIEEFLVNNSAFFNHVHVINQNFDILPNKPHYGIAIDYVDLIESREQFVRELFNTVLDWVYSQAKQEKIINDLRREGRTHGNISTELVQKAFDKFRVKTDGSLIQGQFGELLLANCLQELFNAIPLLRKMPITTSPEHERFGVDAIHYAVENDNHVFYIGEAKSYISEYKFNTAFEMAISSIIKEYNNHRGEIKLYLHEDFLEEPLQKIATDYINNNLSNVKVNLVSIVAYEESDKKTGLSKEEILACINDIITKRYKNFDNNKLDFDLNPILNRITYVVFPIWEFDKLISEFANLIPKTKKIKEGKP
jgi:hypothetical protein